MTDAERAGTRFRSPAALCFPGSASRSSGLWKPQTGRAAAPRLAVDDRLRRCAAGQQRDREQWREGAQAGATRLDPVHASSRRRGIEAEQGSGVVAQDLPHLVSGQRSDEIRELGGLGEPLRVRVVGSEEHPIGSQPLDQRQHVLLIERGHVDVAAEDFAGPLGERSAEPAAAGSHAGRLVHPLEQRLDPRGAVLDRYSGWGLPTHYFVDRDGVIRGRYFGPLSRDLMETQLRVILAP